jgi:hypothetical protein
MVILYWIIIMIDIMIIFYGYIILNNDNKLYILNIMVNIMVLLIMVILYWIIIIIDIMIIFMVI